VYSASGRNIWRKNGGGTLARGVLLISSASPPTERAVIILGQTTFERSRGGRGFMFQGLPWTLLFLDAKGL